MVFTDLHHNRVPSRNRSLEDKLSLKWYWLWLGVQQC